MTGPKRKRPPLLMDFQEKLVTYNHRGVHIRDPKTHALIETIPWDQILSEDEINPQPEESA